jgi:hypothetical protein
MTIPQLLIISICASMITIMSILVFDTATHSDPSISNGWSGLSNNFYTQHYKNLSNPEGAFYVIGAEDFNKDIRPFAGFAALCYAGLMTYIGYLYYWEWKNETILEMFGIDRSNFGGYHEL